jgi:hypothetical protein
MATAAEILVDSSSAGKCMLWSIQVAEGARHWVLLEEGKSVISSCGFSLLRRSIYSLCWGF